MEELEVWSRVEKIEEVWKKWIEEGKVVVVVEKVDEEGEKGVE